MVWRCFLIIRFKKKNYIFHLGFDRLTKKIKCQGEKCKTKRKTSIKVDDFIVELAFLGCMALAISIEIGKKSVF